MATSTSLSPSTNLANFYLDQGRLAGAEPLYRRALALAEKGLAPPDKVPADWFPDGAVRIRLTPSSSEPR